MGKHLVFVYGTLKSGHTRQSAMREERYIGIAKTMPKYGMYQYGSYPAMVDSELDGVTIGRAIYGELYEVSDAGMMALDEIEGTGHGLFERKPVELDTVTLTQLPVEEKTWLKIANKTAVAYVFKNLSKLHGARDCGSIWTMR